MNKAQNAKKRTVDKVMDYQDRMVAGLAGLVGYLAALLAIFLYSALDGLGTPWSELMVVILAVLFKSVSQKLYVCWLVPLLIGKGREHKDKLTGIEDLTEEQLVEKDSTLRILYLVAASSTATGILLKKAGWDITPILWICTGMAFATGWLEHWSDIGKNLQRREYNDEPTTKGLSANQPCVCCQKPPSPQSSRRRFNRAMRQRNKRKGRVRNKK